MKPLKILVPVDFSSFSSYATDFATLLAQKYKADITLYHVVVMYETEVEEEVHLKNIEEIVKHKMLTTSSLLEEKQKNIELNNFKIHSVSEHGINAATSILSYIESNNFDLVIIGTHGRTGFKNWIYGSVAEKVVRLVKIPAITVHHKPASSKIKNILVPIDFSENSKKGMDTARKVAATFKSQINYIHIIEQQLHPTFHVVGIESVFTINSDLKDVSLNKLKSFCFKQGETSTFTVLEGTAHREISDYAKEISCDLIIMSTHGYTGLDHVLIGSTTERVVRIAPCPVLIVGGKR